MTDIEIYKKLATLPKEMKIEVGHYIDYLQSKTKTGTTSKRKTGLAKGLIKMKKDFDEPLEDFNEYME